jgi:DNA invertase Pin-like site-specific DNA recombinase
MLKAAIYARKSTDDSERNTENKSVTRQVDTAKAYAQRKGWAVHEQHIYVDDGISGAEFRNRPGLKRLLNDLKQFDVVVMSEVSRLGRDMLRNAVVIDEIVASGKRLFYYLTDEEEKADTPEQRVMVTLKSYAAEVEREKSSQRVRDALERKARKGYNTGGVVYGYDNVPVMLTGSAGEPVKSHTDYKVNLEQAAVINAIFQMCADGHGLKTIAKTLNGDLSYAELSLKYFDGKRPASPRKGTGSWSASTLHPMLRRPRYLGKIPFGQYRNTRQGGRSKLRVKQKSYLLAERPDLRIIADALWNRVQERLQANAGNHRKLNPTSAAGGVIGTRESKYLLSGLARCACCGSSLVVISGSSGSQAKRRYIHYYVCSYRHNRGATVCDNNWRERLEQLDGAVLDAIREQVLTPERVGYVVDKAFALIAKRHTQSPDREQALEVQLRQLRGELDQFMKLIAGGSAPTTILEEITKREAEITQLKVQLDESRTRFDGYRDERRLKQRLYAKIGRFSELMYSEVPKARQALCRLLNGPILCKPETIDGQRTLVFRGETNLGTLLEPTFITMATPRGFDLNSGIVISITSSGRFPKRAPRTH